MNANVVASLTEQCVLAHASEPRRAPTSVHCEASSADSAVAVSVGSLHVDLVAASPRSRPTAKNPYAPKLTVDQRREAVRMCERGASQRAVARHFGVGRRCIQNLVERGRYGDQPKTEQPVPPPSSPPSERVVPAPSRRGARRGVDVFVHGLPLATHRSLEALAMEVGCSVAAFVRELIVCSVLPLPPHRAMPIRRVGLRHRIATWEPST